jgi:hypothetical protein
VAAAVAGGSGCITLRAADVTMTLPGTYDAVATTDAVSAPTAYAVH